MERQSMAVDIACVGFGPAMGGFLTTLSRGLVREDGTPAVESAVAPGLGVLILGNSVFEGVGTAFLIPPVYILTTLLFAEFHANPQLAKDQFKFVPPKGADVVGE